jgi:outer membrane protein
VKKAVVMVLMVGLLCAGVAQAQDKLRIGVLDIRKVLFESKPGKQQGSEIEKMVKERRDKLAKEDSNIKLLYEKLEKDKLTMTDKQKEQKQKEIDDKKTALQKSAQEAEQQVAKRRNELLSDASKVVQEIIADVAKKEKLSMVIGKNESGIFWVEETVDITEQVANAYEAKAK